MIKVLVKRREREDAKHPLFYNAKKVKIKSKKI